MPISAALIVLLLGRAAAADAVQAGGRVTQPKAGSSAAPQFEVRAATSAMLGVPVRFEAVVRASPGMEVVPDLAASTTDAYSIIGAQVTGQGPAGALTETRFSLDLLPLDVGKVPVRVAWSVKDGPGANPVRAESSAFTVEVAGPDLGPEPKLKDIKAIMTARPALWPWLLLAALLAAGWWAWKRHRASAPEEEALAPVQDTRPPHVIAESELSSLENSGLWEEGRYKEFYIRLTDILRQYVERRYGVAAVHLTTSELVRDLRKMEVDRRVGAAVKDLFDRADLAKFARWKPEAGLGAREVSAGREIVRDSLPRDLAQGGPAQGAQAARP